MREFRGWFTGSPLRADRQGEPGNVLGRIHVRVQPCSALTGEAVPLPFSDSPAHAACLRRVGGVDVDHAQPGCRSLVGHELLKLLEGPSMQPRPDTFPGLDVGADVGQVFHADFARARTQGFRNDGLTGFVVDMLDMPLLATGDSPQFPLCGTATVGLEATAMGKMDVALVAQFPATPDLASAGGGEVIFAHVNSTNTTAENRRRIGKIEDEVEVPDAFANDQLRFLGGTSDQQVALMLATGKRDSGAARQREQGERVALDRVGALVEIDGRGPEGDHRDWLVPGDALVGLERLVGIGNAVDGLADHLAAKRRESFADRVVTQVVQGNAVPAAMLLCERDDGVARIGIDAGQSRKRFCLPRRCQQLEGNRPFHIGTIVTKDRPNRKRKLRQGRPLGGAPIPPRPEGRGLSAQIG